MAANGWDALYQKFQNMVPGLRDIVPLWRTGRNIVLGSTSVVQTHKIMVDKPSRHKLENYHFSIQEQLKSTHKDTASCLWPTVLPVDQHKHPWEFMQLQIHKDFKKHIQTSEIPLTLI